MRNVVSTAGAWSVWHAIALGARWGVASAAHDAELARAIAAGRSQASRLVLSRLAAAGGGCRALFFVSCLSRCCLMPVQWVISRSQ